MKSTNVFLIHLGKATEFLKRSCRQSGWQNFILLLYLTKFYLRIIGISYFYILPIFISGQSAYLIFIFYRFLSQDSRQILLLYLTDFYLRIVGKSCLYSTDFYLRIVYRSYSYIQVIFISRQLAYIIFISYRLLSQDSQQIFFLYLLIVQDKFWVTYFKCQRLKR